MDKKNQREIESSIKLPWGNIWYKTVGDPSNPPLLVLHGGPGYPSDYLWNLDKLANEYFVVYYDQLGCGRSDRNDDPEYWTTEYFVKELSEVINYLHLNNVHLLGHSWGSMLATDYLLIQTKEIKSVIFASPCISASLWEKATARYLDELPNGLGDLIRTYERTGDTKAAEYKAARHLYHTTHECRINPEPENVRASNLGFNPKMYRYMWGPNEYTVSGTLKDYDRSNRLREISIPALFTCGRYDGASPEAVSYYQSQLPGSELTIFEHSSHMPHLEEEGKYLECLGEFLHNNRSNLD
jgi:proline iminopeptidase